MTYSSLPHLALLALVNAPKSTDHSLPGASSFPSLGTVKSISACLRISETLTLNFVRSFPKF